MRWFSLDKELFVTLISLLCFMVQKEKEGLMINGHIGIHSQRILGFRSHPSSDRQPSLSTQPTMNPPFLEPI